MQGKTGFDRLLKRYLRDRVCGREQETFEAWLDTDKTDSQDSFAWMADDEHKLFERITGNIDRQTRTDGWWMTRRLPNSLAVGHWIKMAATVLLILMASYGMWDSFKGTLRKSDGLAGCHLKKFSALGKHHDDRLRD
jgi:hypothetical protein